MSDSLIIGIVAVILSISYTIAITVLVSRALYRTLSSLERVNVNSQRQLSTMLDRLMTIKWEDFAAVRSIEEATDDGGFFGPDDEDEQDTMVIKPEFERVPALEREFLDEDFTPEGDPKRGAA